MGQFFKVRTFQIAAIALAVFLVLIVNREFGAADNGDFVRYMREYASIPVNMKDTAPALFSDGWKDRYFYQPEFYWKPELPDFAQPWFTSATVFWKLGDLLGEYLFSPNVVNLRYIGLPLCLLHFFALFLMIRRVPPATMGSALAIMGTFLVMTDARISAFYNSFYAESVPFVALFTVFCVLSCRMFSREPVPQGTWSESGLFALSLAMLLLAVLAKRQYLYFVGPALILSYYYLAAELRLRRIQCFALLGVFAVVLAYAVSGVTTSQRIDNPEELEASRYTSYHALYFGLLPHSKKQTQLLAELGLPAASESFIGKDAWDPVRAKFIVEHQELTIATYLRAIVLDPRAFLGSLWQNAKQVGNFDIGLGMTHGDRMKFPPALISAFSTGFTKMAGAGIFVLSVLLAGALVLFPVGDSAERRFACRILSLILLVIIVSDVAISTFDGRQEARKHVMVASLAAALMLVCGIAALVGRWRQRPQTT
ncbi:hypothetical protein [Achromobacter sp. DH1f]|uniref:glycan biosynthesis hexose transferase WsfD n=1 Tax=Achromobacter sp. DH1f TaxID=1397275 RepID=UPI00046813C0|nr:hypothetical protein [Achromobacter sp. DH1f]